MKLISAALAVLVASAVVQAENLPQRKPGLWELTVSRQGAPQPSVMKQCTDAASDEKMLQMGSEMGAKIGANCSKRETKKVDEKYVADVECTIGGSKVVSHSEFSGDFKSSYSGEARATFDPPMMGMKESLTKISAKWIGPCEAGQVPGDMMLSNGMKMNINSMPKMPDLKNLPNLQNMPK